MLYFAVFFLACYIVVLCVYSILSFHFFSLAVFVITKSPYFTENYTKYQYLSVYY